MVRSQKVSLVLILVRIFGQPYQRLSEKLSRIIPSDAESNNMALGLSVASDIASAALTFYVRGAALEQTMQDRPLLRILNAAKETFPGGKDNISLPVQGAFMSDTAGFFAGYSEDD